MTLAKACRCLDEEDVAGALAHVLAVWRAHRDAALVDAIVALGRALPARPLAPVASHAEILARIAEDDPADVDLLVALPLPRARDNLDVRLRGLAARAADPRIATYLHHLVDAPPTKRGTFWRALFDAIAAVGDPRSLDHLQGFARRIEQVVGRSKAPTVRNRLDECTGQLRRIAAETRPLGAADRAALPELAARVHALEAARTASSADGAALLEAVRANPRDERAIAVWGDWLQERGDPRGEFVALQLAHREPARQRALIRKLGTSWLGPVATVTTQTHTRFERGLPVAVTVNGRNEPTLAAAVGAPEWATIEELTFTGMLAESEVCAALVCHPAMRALRDVRGLGLAPMRLVAAAKPPLPITHVTVRIYVTEELGYAPGLPALQRLTTSQCYEAADIAMLLGLQLPYELAFVDGLDTRYVVSRARDVLRIELAGRGIQLAELHRIPAALPKLRALEIAVPDPAEPGLEESLARQLGRVWRSKLPRKIIALGTERS